MTINLEKVLLDTIQRTFESEAERIFEEKKQEMVAEMEKRKNELVSGIVIGLMKHVQMETMRENIVITIREIPGHAD